MVNKVNINIKGKNKKRRYTKRRQALTKKEKTEVQRIAKRVFKSNVEHKYIMQSTEETQVRCAEIYAINPMGSITVGTDSQKRIGEVINNVRLRVKMSYIHLGRKVSLPDIKQWPKSQFRVMVIKTKRQLLSNSLTWPLVTNTIGSTTTASKRDDCLFYQPTGWGYPYHSAMQDVRKDNDYKVLYDRTVSAMHHHGYTNIDTNNFFNIGDFKNLKFSVKLGKFEFEENDPAFARKGLENVYILVTPYIPKTLAGIDIAGEFVCQYSLTWTDA